MQTLSVEQRTFFEQAATLFQSDLAADTAAQAYLASRGITPEIAHGFRLGVVRSRITGLESRMGRLAIPYITPAGVVNFSFRCLRGHDCKAEGCPKYLPVDGYDRNLYNVLDLKKESPFICLAEGEIDTITLSALCGLPAVGVPGAKQWKRHWPKCLEDASIIYVFGDPDTAGDGLNNLLARESRARPVRIPKGHDVNSLHLQGGPDALQRLLRG